MSAAAGLALLLHALLVVGAAVLLPGFCQWLEAKATGRPAASPLSSWYELLRLARKETLRERGGAGLMRLLPAARVGVLATAVLLVPSFVTPLPEATFGGLLTVIGMLALARTLAVLAALDSGLALGGVAAGRAILAGAVGDGGLFLTGFALSVSAGATSFVTLAAGPPTPLAWGLLALALAILGLIANERLPLGGGNEWAAGEAAANFGLSGRDLALFRLGDGLRLVVWFDLLSCLLLPAGIAAPTQGAESWAIGVSVWLAKLILFAAGLALAASGTGRLSPAGVRWATGTAWLLALLAGVAVIAAGRPA